MLTHMYYNISVFLTFS